MDETLKLTIDSTGATSGARTFTTAISQIKTALSQLEQSSSSLAKLKRALGDSNTAGALRNLQGLNSVKLSATTVKNIEALAAALSRLKAVGGFSLGPVAQELASLSNLKGVLAQNTNRATQATQNYRQQAVRLRGDMRGLENAFSASYQAGSLFRTVLGSLTLGEFTRQLMDAGNALISFNAQMQAVAGQMGATVDPAQFTAQQFKFVTEAADRMALSLQNVMREYPKLATAMLLSGRTADEAQRVFNAFGGAMRVMGLSAERQQLVMLALTQVFSKGTVSAEELRRQLGEQIPGAFEMMQESIRKVTNDPNFNLDKALRNGEIGSDAILLLAQRMEQVYGAALPNALKSSSAQFTRLSNEFVKFKQEVSAGGFDAALAEMFMRLTEGMKSPEFAEFTKNFTRGAIDAVKAFSDIAVWASQNVKLLAGAMGALVAYNVLQGLVQLAANIRIVGISVQSTLLPLALATAAVLALSAAFDAAGAAKKRMETGKTEVSMQNAQAREEFNRLTQDMQVGTEAQKAASAQERRERIQVQQERLRVLQRQLAEAQQRRQDDPNNLKLGAAGSGRSLTGRRQVVDADTLAGQVEQQKSFVDELIKQVQREEDLAARAKDAATELDASGLDIFKKGGTGGGAGARNRQQRQADNLVQSLYPLVEVTRDYADAQKIVGLATADLTAAGITQQQALDRYQKTLLMQNGLMTEAEQIQTTYAMRVEDLALARKAGQITEEQQQRLLAENNDLFREQNGLFTESESLNRQYIKQQERINTALQMRGITEEQALRLQQELNDTYAESIGVYDAATLSIQRYEKALRNANESKLSEADKAKARDNIGRDFRRDAGTSTVDDAMTNMRSQMDRANAAGGNVGGAQRRIGRETAREIEGMVGNTEEQIKALKELASQGYITYEELNQGIIRVTAANARMQASLGNDSFLNSFRATVLDTMASMKDFASTMGDVFGDVLTTGVRSLSDELAKLIVRGGDLREILYNIATDSLQQIISAVIQWGIQMLLLKALGIETQQANKQTAQDIGKNTAAQVGAIIAISGAQIVAGPMVAAAWEAAAMNVSLATAGANAIGAVAGIAAVKTALGAAGSSGGAPGAPGAGGGGSSRLPGTLTAATGGFVTGPGTATSDSIPARLSNGEFVVNAAATRNNLPLLNAINNDMPIPMMYSGGGSPVITNNLTINVEGNGDGEQIAAAVIPQLEAMTLRIIKEQQRPGGMLRRV